MTARRGCVGLAITRPSFSIPTGITLKRSIAAPDLRDQGQLTCELAEDRTPKAAIGLFAQLSQTESKGSKRRMFAFRRRKAILCVSHIEHACGSDSSNGESEYDCHYTHREPVGLSFDWAGWWRGSFRTLHVVVARTVRRRSIRTFRGNRIILLSAAVKCSVCWAATIALD